MEKIAFLMKKNYAWSSLDSCSDYKYVKIYDQFNLRQLFTVVNYGVVTPYGHEYFIYFLCLYIIL